MKYDLGQQWEKDQDKTSGGSHVSQAGENVPGEVLHFSGPGA